MSYQSEVLSDSPMLYLRLNDAAGTLNPVDLARVETTGDTTNSSTTVAIADTSDIYPGMYVVGTGIQADSTVVSKTGSSITLNLAATATATGVDLSIYFPVATNLSGPSSIPTFEAAGLLAGDADEAADFDNSDRAIAVFTGQYPSGTITLEIWIKPDSVQDRVLFSVYNDGARVEIKSGKLRYTWYPFGPYVESSAISYSVGDTLHIVFNIDESTGDVKFYLNGVSVLAGNIGSAVGFGWNVNNPRLIIGYVYGVGSAMDGIVDEVAMYDYLLSGARVAAHYTSGTTIPPADTDPPTVPASLTNTAVTMTTATYTWAASTDDTAVTGYKIKWEGGAAVDIGNVLTYQKTGLTPNTVYATGLQVSAYDAEANESAFCAAVPATTSAPVPEILSATVNGAQILVAFDPGGVDASTTDIGQLTLSGNATLNTDLLILSFVAASGTTNPQGGTITLSHMVHPGLDLGLTDDGGALENSGGPSEEGVEIVVDNESDPEDITDAVTFEAAGPNEVDWVFVIAETVVNWYMPIAELKLLVNGAEASPESVVDGDMVTLSIEIGGTVLAVTDAWQFLSGGGGGATSDDEIGLGLFGYI
jgi:hypothetical protein